jgi:Na+-translocating ferredoxin:NAD+ oxidoreductase RnfG subunit
MNPFRDNIPLVVFASMAIGLYAGKYIGIIDGIQREKKAQARRNRIQQELRSERHKQRHEKWQKFSGQVK